MWTDVITLAEFNGLMETLNGFSTRKSDNRLGANWTLHPLGGYSISMFLSNAGVLLSAARGNHQNLVNLHIAISTNIARNSDVFITPIRVQKSGYNNFAIKPKPWLKKDTVKHIDALYQGLELLVEAIKAI